MLSLLSLNLLKNVNTSKVNNGLIVRLEFEKPVSKYKEPKFFDKSVQVDFPLAFIKPAKKYYPAESFALTKIFAAQYDAETLRVRFLKKDNSDISGRFHLAQQGRFIIVRLDQSTPDLQLDVDSKIEIRNANEDDLMNEDELVKFLARASEKFRTQGLESSSDKEKSTETSVRTEDIKKSKEVTDIIVTRAGMGVEPLVNRIKKAALSDSSSEKKEVEQKSKNSNLSSILLYKKVL